MGKREKDPDRKTNTTKDWKFLVVCVLLVCNMFVTAWLVYSNNSLLQFTMQFVTDVFYTNAGIEEPPVEDESFNDYSEPGTYYNDDGSIVDVQVEDHDHETSSSN